MIRTYQLNHWLWGSLDWLFPPVCGGCNRTGSRWCPDCQEQVRPVPEPICRVCGALLTRPGLCSTCNKSHPPYEMMRSWVVFEGPIRLAIHSLKYKQNLALGDTFAQYLAEYVRELGWQADLVVPVPLGRQRLKERGYNQAGLLAKPLSGRMGWKFSNQVLVRARETHSQVGLSPVERKANIAGAFRADPGWVAGKSILLMDDVATTGSTLEACSDALVKAGAKTVYALSLAKALPHHGFQIV